jgi:serine O-acetyltransferase
METYKCDSKRNVGGGYVLRFLLIYRYAQSVRSKFLKILCKIILRRYRIKYGLEIPIEAQIGKGLYIGHAFNITINPHVVIGDSCNLHKGCLIGQENRGGRRGAPRLGNKVWVGINAVVVGNIVIGDDVLIAPNSYVNCDVPSHSIVYGNPCIIKHRDNATECYINNIVE